ncbi:MAG: GxxExxY protein [Halofilum sp. (in: g-proteobacteria)]|nr:GxxExxY protein [Halofilum sp. (in: g-proteobacteria)]
MGTTENTGFTDNTEKAGKQDPEGAVSARAGLVHGDLAGVIRQAAFEVHRYFGCGFLEKVYENALAGRLRKQGYEVAGQASLQVRDEDGQVVGEYIADLIVQQRVLVEIKAVSGLVPEHQAQVLNYLKATGLRVGMLINFGQTVMQVKRVVR